MMNLYKWLPALVDCFTFYGSGKGSSAPAAPDPTVSAAAQTKSNQQTAAYNSALARYNTQTPLGNQTWTQTGTDPTTGAPIWNNSISLNPTAQGTLTQNMQNANALSQTQGQFLNNVKSQLAQPMNTSGISPVQTNVNSAMGDPAIQNAINASYKNQTALLDPQFQQQQTSMQAQLANQGITPGSEAYNNAMQNMGRSQDFAYSQAANNATLQGQNEQNVLFNQNLGNANLNNQSAAQQMSNLFSLRNQPLNEYNSMMNGTQVQMPQFQGTASSAANGTDVLSAINSAYQGQLNSYNAQVGSQNSFNNGLFSLGGAALMAFSDARLKSNIRKIGKTNEGFNIYSYHKFGVPEIGVMAQEVADKRPDLVGRHESGYLMVNYEGLK